MSYRKADKEGFQKLMKELRQLSFDDLIDKHQDTEIKFKNYGKDYSVRLIQDSYVGSTGEAMIIRKLRNVAIRNFPKNFDTTVIETLYRDTFEEKYERTNVVEATGVDASTAGSIQIETSETDTVAKVQQSTEQSLQNETKEVVIDDELEGLV